MTSTTRPMITLIAALTNRHVIGVENKLPWHLPADLRHFKQLTLGKPVLMGRKTFESIGKALPGRLNIVVTTDAHFNAPGCRTAGTIDAALTLAHQHNEVMIIGGASFYAQTLPLARRMYLTLVHADHIVGDAFFPNWEKAEWQETAREDHLADENNGYAYSFVTLERQ